MKYVPPKLTPMRPPNGDYGPETPSGVYRALKSTRQKLKVGSVLAGILTAGSIAGGVLAGVNVVNAQVDAGQKAQKERIDFLAADLREHKREEAKKAERQEAKTDRLDQKLDLLLDKARVPPELRPERADGGK